MRALEYQILNQGSKGNTGLDSYEPLVTSSSTNQYITLFYVSFSLKKPLLYIIKQTP